MSFWEALSEGVRGEVIKDEVGRGIYATDASHYQVMPSCVVTPMDEADCIAAARVALEHGLALTARGAGTSLSGQTHGPGMILDLSRHMNGVLEINADEGWARVQPGVVRDHLNFEAAAHGLHFAPDPATSSRATVGGMIGNNSAGTRSVTYGKTSDHLIACRVLIGDGSVVDCEAVAPSGWQGRAGELLQGLQTVVDANREQIRQRFPTVMRRVGGYALDAFLDDPDEQPWNLARLFCGAEGTLGILLEAKVRLVPLPAATAVCVLHFDELLDSLRQLEAILAHEPSAVELLDGVVIREARTNVTTRELAGFVEGNPAAVLLVEISAASAEDAERRVRALAEDLRARGIGYAQAVFTDAAAQHRVWEVRRLGLGLITNVPGARKGQAFVEDACVPIPVLAEYIGKLIGLCEELDVPYSLYAHASVGVIHFRPMLDLHLDEEVANMRRIAEQAFEWVMEYGGSWSGEHGDGLVRGEFIDRFYGPEISAAFREIKTLFDPKQLMNPGKIIDPPPMDENMRYRVPLYREHTAEADDRAWFQFREQGGLTLAVEQCNGVGACRKIGSGVMCPSYMATRDEQDCTRGRANALRLAISGQLDEARPVQAMGSDGLYRVMELCLGCKACKAECPNAVDVAKMKAETLQHRYDSQGGHRRSVALIGNMPVRAAGFCGLPFVNAIQEWSPLRRALARKAGIDVRRPLPRFARTSFTRQAKRRGLKTSERKVVLYVDSYTNAWEPHIGLAALDLLEGCGFEVVLADAGDSQRARISKGLLRLARKDGFEVMRKLDASSGPIICLEPSCASSLKDDLPDLIEDADLGNRVADRVMLIEQFLVAEHIVVKPRYPKLLVHGHCHQKAVFGMSALTTLLPDAEIIEAGCCGMAGSFGYEHYDLSMKIGEDRLFPAVRGRDPEAVLVACGFSCRHQVHDACGLMPRHLVEVIEAG